MGEILDAWYSRPIDVHRWSDHPEVKERQSKDRWMFTFGSIHANNKWLFQ